MNAGTWDGTAPVTVSDSWYDCTTDAVSTTSCTPIAGATGASYTLTSTDVGDYVYASESASNSDTVPPAPSQNSNLVGPATAEAPANSSPPALSGNSNQGGTLTATPGTWSNNPTYSYAWYDCTGTAPNLTCNPSPTSTDSATYAVTAGDTGFQIEVQVTATNDGVSATENSAPEPASVGLPVNTTPPSITGTLQTGSILTENDGVWTNSPILSRQWIRCAGATCSPIAGQTAATYTLAAADLGDTIEVVVTATNAAVTSGGTAAPTAIAMTGPVVLPPAINKNPPTISGDAQEGQTLIEKMGNWTGSQLTYREQWSRCDSDGNNCVPIPQATGLQYTVTSADIGGTLEVTETATNSGGSVPATSGLTDPVTNAAGVVPAPALTSAGPQVSGAASFGSTLTATRVAFNGNPGTYSFQWQRCSPAGCLDIPGATSLSYVVTAADVGYALHIVESAVNSGGASSLAQSANTARVTAPSTTILQRSVGDPVAGQSVSLIAAVASPAASLEAGTITFSAHGKAIRGCAGLALPAVPTQPVLCHATFAASRHAVVATFTPDPGTYVTGSASSATALTVRRVPTTLTLGTSARILLGKHVTYRATVQPGSSGSLKPAGRVTFLDGTKPIPGCDRVRLHGAAAACTVRYLSLRTHTISIRYTGNHDFAAARSAGRRVTVAAQSPSGVVNAFMSWTFAYGPAATQVRTLSVSGLAAGTRISMVCSGGGCAFHHYTRTISIPARCSAHTHHRCRGISLNLTPAFDHHSLDVGAHVTVMLSHPGWLGKYYLFTIRHGRKPALRESCLAVGGIRPSVGCTAAA